MSMVMFAYDFYGVVQSAWLKQAFGVSEAQLGQTAAIAGAAELCGSVGVALLVDRLGKKRTAIGGFLIAALCLALLPLSTISWVLFLGLQFCFFLAEEFAIVAALPLISGVAPTARGTVLSLNITITSMVRALGAGLSVGVWERSGIWTNALVAAALTAAAALICGLFVREVEGERAVQGQG
jgi:predicted MFS family arabinose efflux permease